MSQALSIEITPETWELDKPFVIARGSRTETSVVKISIQDGLFTGQGEAVPNTRYDETVSSTTAEVKSISAKLQMGIGREELQNLMPAGAARNAVDCALWDLEAKRKHTSVSRLLDFPEPKNIITVQTLSIDSPANMGKEAYSFRSYPILKIKLDKDHIASRLRAVHKNAPRAKLLIDANESWNLEILETVIRKTVDLPIVMIEQPLKAGQDKLLKNFKSRIPIGADESCHTVADIPHLAQYYDVVNIKLDKSGGLTEAVKLANTAKQYGLEIMVGCMVGTSLSMAPGLVLATQAKFVDLDGPALLKHDRKFGLKMKHGIIEGLNPKLWGSVIA